MTERKCGQCRKPGHTRPTCPDELAIRADEMEGMGQTAEMTPVADTVRTPTIVGMAAQYREIYGNDVGMREAPGPRMDDDSIEFTAPDPDTNWNNTGHPKPTYASVVLGVLGTEEGAEQSPAAAPLDAFVSPTPMGPEALAIDAFVSPTPAAPVVSERQQTNRLGYLLKDPELGDFRRNKSGTVKAITRTTTFNKAASDRTALTDWGKRNVLVGASRRPDLVALAHRKDVSVDKTYLDTIVAKLEEAADAKVSADIGTMVHDYTEKIDAGVITLDDVPPAYRDHVVSYTEALSKAGLQVIGSLIEGTVFVKEFGGVAGKFDRVLYHPASHTYVMGDLKTGKNMIYGWDEIETQESIYTTGYNEFGTYDWDTDTWVAPEFQVRTDVGVVMWLPVQTPTEPYPEGFSKENPPQAGHCYLLKTDLARGWRHAQLCAAVRAERAAKGKPGAWTAPERNWMAELTHLTTVAAARDLWLEADAAGAPAAVLDWIVLTVKDRVDAGSLTA